MREGKLRAGLQNNQERRIIPWIVAVKLLQYPFSGRNTAKAVGALHWRRLLELFSANHMLFALIPKDSRGKSLFGCKDIPQELSVT
jgi:hypothetical protein